MNPSARAVTLKGSSFSNSYSYDNPAPLKVTKQPRYNSTTLGFRIHHRCRTLKQG